MPGQPAKAALHQVRAKQWFDSASQRADPNEETRASDSRVVGLLPRQALVALVKIAQAMRRPGQVLRDRAWPEYGIRNPNSSPDIRDAAGDMYRTCTEATIASSS
jgi:hypothetical protein